MNLREAASMSLAGVLLLSAWGCASDVAPERQTASSEDQSEVASKVQAVWREECIAECESAYNDAFYACQIQLGGWSCYMLMMNAYNTCINSCPACDSTYDACANYCYDELSPELHPACYDACLNDYCH